MLILKTDARFVAIIFIKLMRIVYLNLLFLIAFTFQAAFAQDKNTKSDVFKPSFLQPQPTPDGVAQTNALFDLQFNYNMAQKVSAANGFAGVVFFNKEFWVSKWGSDTIFRLDSLGNRIERFRIPSVKKVRAMTFDGTNIYAAQNTFTIAVIDPITKTQISTISTPPALVDSARYITYIKSLDGGNGGFLVGNFNSAFFLISKTGTLLSTISRQVHKQAGVYGVAYDTLSPGGPFLWTFSQGSSNATQVLTRLNGNSFEPSPVSRNVILDITGTTGALAGGMFVAPRVNGDVPIIGGILQGNPNRLFGYELGEFVLPPIEAEMYSFLPDDEYVIRPPFLNPRISFSSKLTNAGSQTFDSIYVDTKLFDADSNEIASGTEFAQGLVFADSVSLGSGFTYQNPAVGVYRGAAKLRLSKDKIDPTPANNALEAEYIVSDSSYSRCFMSWDGALGIGTAPGGLLGNKYNFAVPTVISSITGMFLSPTEGDSVFFQVSNFIGNSPGNAVSARTNAYVFTQEDASNGIMLTLPLRGGPRRYNAGNFMISVREHLENVSLANNSRNWRPTTSYVRIGTGAWQATESAGFKRTFLLFPNVKLPTDVNAFTESKYKIFPNPAKGFFEVQAEENAVFILRTNLGQEVLRQEIQSGKHKLSSQNLPTGMYYYQIESKKGKSFGKLMLN